MNWDAYRENESNERAVQAFDRQGKLVLEIDRHKVTYNGTAWLNLADYDKRKLENKLFMHFSKHRKPLHFLYC